MRRITFALSGIVAAGALVACEDDPARPSNRMVETFAATLSGANERPTPNTSTASGSGAFQVISKRADAGSPFVVDTIVYAVTWTGLTTNTSGGHIHGPASAEQSIGVLVNFGVPTTATSGSVSGTIPGTITSPITLDSLAVLFRNEMSYVNIHSTATGGGYPGGEVRGQIVPAP